MFHVSNMRTQRSGWINYLLWLLCARSNLCNRSVCDKMFELTREAMVSPSFDLIRSQGWLFGSIDKKSAETNLTSSHKDDGIELGLHIIGVQLLHVLLQLMTKLQHRLLADANQFPFDRRGKHAIGRRHFDDYRLVLSLQSKISKKTRYL